MCNLDIGDQTATYVIASNDIQAAYLNSNLQ